MLLPNEEKKRWFLPGCLLGGIGAGVLTIIATFYVVENYRGRQRLERIETELRGKKEPMTLAEIIPPPIPDRDNLAAIPFFRPLWPLFAKSTKDTLEDTPEGRRLAEFHLKDNDNPVKKPSGDWLGGKPADLTAWQRYFAASKKFPHPPTPGRPSADVLAGLQFFEPELSQLRTEAAQRPGMQFPIRYQDNYAMRLPHMTIFMALPEILSLRSWALLEENRTDEALGDLLLATHLLPPGSDASSLVAAMLTTLGQRAICRTVREGLETRRWSPDQLQALQDLLRKQNPVKTLKDALRTERVAFYSPCLEKLRNDPSQLAAITSLTEDLSMAHVWLRAAPAGWWDQNEAIGLEILQHCMVEALDEKRRIVTPRTQEFDVALVREPLPYIFFPKISLPVMASIITKTALTQSMLSQTIIACALERHRLEHGFFPDQLRALVPAYLDAVPPDAVAGGSLVYRHEGDSFVLYSTGWNIRDDGGKVVFKKSVSGMPSINEKAGDWVWPHLAVPAK